MTTITINMDDADAKVLHRLIIKAEEEGEFLNAFNLKITKE